MRIIIYSPYYLPAIRYGGPIASVHGLAKGLVALGNEVHVWTTNVDGPNVLDVEFSQPNILDGVIVRYFPVEFPRRYFRCSSMRNSFADIKHFDLLHLNGLYLWPGPALAQQADRHRVPYVLSPRGMLLPELIEGKSKFLKHIWLTTVGMAQIRNAAAIHATSQYELETVRAFLPSHKHVALVENGVELANPRLEALSSEKVWGGIARGSRVAFLGRIDWMKGVDIAIKATQMVEGATLLIAGPDQIGLERQLNSSLKREDGSVFAKFIGTLDGTDKWAFLSGADLLVAPSLRESFGMSVAEALSVGTLAICTPGVGAADILRRVHCSAVTERDPDSLARAIRYFLSDVALRKRLGEVGRKILVDEYQWPEIAAKMMNLYKGVTHGSLA